MSVANEDEHTALLGTKPSRVASYDPSGAAAAEAELRLFVRDQMIMQTKKDFGSVHLSEDLLKRLATEAVGGFHIELDVNVVQPPSEAGPITPEVIENRVNAVAFQYDKFLRALKETEQRDNADRTEQSRQAAETIQTLNQIVAAENQGGEIPVNLVEHMLQVGVEQHLLFVREHMVGDAQSMGVTVTFKDLTVARRVPNTMRVVPDGSKETKDERKARLRKLREVLRPSGPQTVWKATATMLFGSCFALADRMGSRGPRTREVQLLKQVNGVLPPGKITLLLGAPHSGKTQLLHALARQTKTEGPIIVTGDVYYNGYSYKKVTPSNFCVLAEQIDKHIPVLTVRETLKFAFTCRARNLAGMDSEMYNKINKHLDARVNMILAVLGLTRAADTVIGNDSLKGISGGEMRRTTLGEMLITGAQVLLLDEISTGLDAAATFDITKSIRALCRVFNVTALVSLLQPPPETVDLFDDTMLMSDGRIVYHGERAKMKQWLVDINLPPSEQQDIADYVIDASIKYREELYQAYLASPELIAEKELLAQDPKTLRMETRFPDNKELVEVERRFVKASKFSASIPFLLRAVTQRQWLVMVRNKEFIIARVIQNVIMGVLLGALFFGIEFQEFYPVSMLLSQLLSMSGFANMSLLGDVVASRDVFYKQSKEHFFPGSLFVIADYLVGLPFTIMDAAILGTISYFMAGLSSTSNGEPFFIFLIIFVSFGVCNSALIRFFGYACPDVNAATALCVVYNVFAIIFSGAIATPSVIPPWFIWFYWGFSPMAWAFRSAMQNEFYSQKYQAECESGCPNNLAGQCVAYCGMGKECAQPYPEVSCGLYFLQARQVETGTWYLWFGIGMLWIYTVFFIFISSLSLRYIRWDSMARSAFEEDLIAETKDGDSELDVLALMEDSTKNKSTTDGDSGPLGDIESKEVALGEKNFVPQPLTWKNIIYTIEINANKRKRNEAPEQLDLLKNVSGFAKPFSLTALMGSSGAGKTTLLDCLCYRKTVGKITGTVTLGNQVVIPKSFKKKVGYVEQFGIHSEKATVRESLEFSARLRLGNDYTRKERQTIVENTLDILGLRIIENHIIGRLGDPDALSFEENKRVTIAVELVSVPSVLFADEPTSGLTSKEAFITMKALSRVAISGRPVICTIHQPSNAIFDLFDRLLLLKRGGEVVYFGDIGKNSSTLIRYFQGIPGVKALPEGLNPATWMLEVIGAGVGRADITNGMDFAEIYRTSDLCKQNEVELEAIMAGGNYTRRPSVHDFEQEEAEEVEKPTEVGVGGAVIPSTASNVKAPLYHRGFMVQFLALSRRNFIEYWRTPTYTLVRWIVQVVFALVMGLTFLGQKMGDVAGVQSRVGIINMLVLLTAIYNSNSIIPFAFSRKALFYREKASSMYASFIYAITLQWVEEPYIFMEVILAVVVFYFLVGMSTSPSSFFYFFFLMYFFVAFTTYLGLMFSAACSTVGSATIFSTLTIQLMILFNGILLPGNLMPDWLLGAYYFTPVRWALEGLIASQFIVEKQAICSVTGTIYTWENGTAPSVNCPVRNGQTFAFYLSDIEVNACCNIYPNRPISAKAYLFEGYTYSDGFVQPGWLGGNNGLHSDWLAYDFIYVVVFYLLVRVIAIIVTQFVSHQMR